ncbi:MAG: hypothetical protein DMF88_04165 [Acidobacteria bacterium]|nr:MAG: hypothetical protein DMF88_04165 [Acidobacteriota bacterium]
MMFVTAAAGILAAAAVPQLTHTGGCPLRERRADADAGRRHVDAGGLHRREWQWRSRTQSRRCRSGSLRASPVRHNVSARRRIDA